MHFAAEKSEALDQRLKPSQVAWRWAVGFSEKVRTCSRERNAKRGTYETCHEIVNSVSEDDSMAFGELITAVAA